MPENYSNQKQNGHFSNTNNGETTEKKTLIFGNQRFSTPTTSGTRSCWCRNYLRNAKKSKARGKIYALTTEEKTLPKKSIDFESDDPMTNDQNYTPLQYA
jgi:hypothetical protein